MFTASCPRARLPRCDCASRRLNPPLRRIERGDTGCFYLGLCLHDREIVIDGEVDVFIFHLDRKFVVLAEAFYLQQKVARLAIAKWSVDGAIVSFD